MQAAIDGQGVALGRSPLVDQLVAQGKLVGAFPRQARDEPRVFHRARGASVIGVRKRRPSSTGSASEAHEEAVEPGEAVLPAPRQSRRRTSPARKKT